MEVHEILGGKTGTFVFRFIFFLLAVKMMNILDQIQMNDHVAVEY